MSEKIAIIGGGIAGLTAAYLLHDRNEVTLFEKDNRIGGNVYTLETKTGEEIDISVFFWSPLLYPNFAKLLTKLGIDPKATKPMEGLSQSYRNLQTRRDFYLSCDTARPRSIFSIKNFKTAFYQVIVLRNYRKIVKMFKKGQLKGMTLREAMEFCPGLKGDLLKLAIFPICVMTSMLWDELMDSPAEFAVAKIEKQVGSPKKFSSWRLYPCKSYIYIQKLAASYEKNIVYNSTIESVTRNDKSVTLKMKDGKEEIFDKVIFACPADTALDLLWDPSREEHRLLSPWRYNDGLVIIHTDSTNYPPEDLWAMYTYLYTDIDGVINTSINSQFRFQNGVPNDSEYMGCQHPNVGIDEDKIEFKRVFRTPVYDNESFDSVKELASLNGIKNTYFCGSHFGFGLHEDAVTSAIDVSKMLGAVWE
ncbi:MAG: FAD-dependent oxidoreductase [bacterium]|nr:FAD-dependent oxidoreductase [bacterium]